MKYVWIVLLLFMMLAGCKEEPTELEWVKGDSVLDLTTKTNDPNKLEGETK
jgi:starvation-inducible outer membrane lipoprotein